jgi:hypothetical protein
VDRREEALSLVFLDFDGHTTYGGNPLLPADYPRIEPDRIIGGLQQVWWPFEIDFVTGIEQPHDHRIVFTGEDLWLGGNYVAGYSLLNIYGKTPAEDGGVSTLPYASYVGSLSSWDDPNPGLAKTAAHELGHAVGIKHGGIAESYAPLKRDSTSWRVEDVLAIYARHPELQPTAEFTDVVAAVQSRPWYAGQSIIITSIT